MIKMSNIQKTLHFGHSYYNVDTNKPLDYNKVSVINGKEYLNKIENKFNKVYTPTAGDILYIFPDSTIPRFKLKSFCEANNIKITNNKQKANILVANPSALSNQMFETKHWLRTLKKESLVKYLNSKVPINNVLFSQLREDIKDVNYEYVLCSYGFLDKINDGKFGISAKFIQYDDVIDEDDPKTLNNHWDFDYKNGPHYLLLEEQEATYQFVEANINNLYHQDALLNLINTGVVIDEELYKGLSNMLESKNSSDHIVALEAMANADYLESAVYILLLFKEHSRRIFECPTRYHVNFKSLCNFFDINRRSYIGIDEIVKKLVEKDILTSKNLYMLLNLVKEEVENSGNTDCFKMTDVLPTPELQELAKITDAKQAKEEPIEEL
jgi:hypothetical protein